MSTNVQVCCRFRPANKAELATGDQVVAVYDGGGKIVNIRIDNPSLMDELGFGSLVAGGAGAEDSAKLAASRSFPQFNFDHVFAPELPQADLYERTAAPLVREIFAGYNTTIFAYGQTGSGKVTQHTYTHTYTSVHTYI